MFTKYIFTFKYKVHWKSRRELPAQALHLPWISPHQTAIIHLHRLQPPLSCCPFLPSKKLPTSATKTKLTHTPPLKSSLLCILSTRKFNVIMAQTTTLKKFESIFPTLVEDVLDHAKQYKLPQEFVDWYKAVRALLTFGYDIADSYSP